MSELGASWWLAGVVEVFSHGDNLSAGRYGEVGSGLTVASQLVSSMNASLKIESVPNIGTSVRFTVCFQRVSPVDDPS